MSTNEDPPGRYVMYLTTLLLIWFAIHYYSVKNPQLPVSVLVQVAGLT